MQLITCHDQKHETLEEFYTELSLHDGHANIMGTSMLELMNRLQVLPDNRKLFGLTSHYSLCLLSEDTCESPWYVRISAIDKQWYQISYLMPEKLAPWPEAYVIGEAHSTDEAVEMILIGMEKSAGWKVQRNKAQKVEHMNIEYFKDGVVNTPLVLIYGNDPAAVEILRRAIDKLVIDIFDRVAVHELPGYVSVNDCKLFIEVGREDIGVWLPKKDEPLFICSLQKETWIKVINKLKPFTDPHIYIYTGGCFQYMTDPAHFHQINLLISTRRGW